MPEAAHQAKRRRIHTACKPCQDRKTRCDGCRPACSTCTRRGVAAECLYDMAAIPPAQRLPSSFAALEERLGRLEQIRLLPDTTTPDVNTRPLQQVPSGRHVSDAPSSGYNHSPVETRRPFIELRVPTPSTAQELGQVEVDGLATVSSVEDSDCIYGASSTIALARFCQGKATGDESPNAVTASAPPCPPNEVLPEAVSDRDESVALYPPRQRADDFVRCFSDFVHPLFPVLHEPSFMQQYERLWSGCSDIEDRQEPSTQLREAVFTSTLNIIFALGCQFSQLVPAQNRTSMAQGFYQRSRRIYNYEILDSMSLPLVQMLLLSGVYLQSAQYANRCWNVVGLAIRAAQGLGLHVETTRARGLSQVDREIRRRVWHCCLVLDRLLSMTFGRPVMISTKGAVPLPSLIDDDYLQAQGEGVQPRNTPSRLGLLTYSSKLFLVLEDILSTFYSSHPDFNVTEVAEEEMQIGTILSNVIALNRRLDCFLAEVPTYLLYAEPSVQDSARHLDRGVDLQRQVLHCRFLYTRVLLLRPVVHLTTKYPSRFLSQASVRGDDNTDDHLVKHFCNLCLQTATDLIHVIHQNLASTYRSSAWHSIYFTFGATVLLLCAQICPAISVEAIELQFERSWAESLAILDHYRVQLPVARQSTQTLQRLKDSLSRHLAKRAPFPPPNIQLTMPLDLPQFGLPGIGPGRDGWVDLDLADFWGFQ